jgi:hypothetical protein
MASSLLAANSTNEAAEALLGAFFAAGRTCGPPNALSSRSATQARTKYKNATCYFIGPVIAAPMRNPTFSYMLNAVAGARLASDAWASGALLGGIVDCVAGGHAAQTPPDWLYQGFGPLSIAPAYAPAGAAVAPVGGAPAAETASAGR